AQNTSTRRPSASVTSGPCGEVSTRSPFHSPPSLIFCSSASITGFMCSNMVSVSPLSSLLSPGHEHDLPRPAVAQQRDRLVEALHGHDVRDRGLQVQPARAQELEPAITHVM